MQSLVGLNKNKMDFQHFGRIVFDDSISIASGNRGALREMEGRTLELRRQICFAFFTLLNGERQAFTQDVTMQVQMYPTGNCQVAAFAYINRFFGRITREKVAKDITLLLETRLLLKKLLLVSSSSIFNNDAEIECQLKPMVLVDYTDAGENENTVNLIFGEENRVTLTPYVSTNGSHMIMSLYKTNILEKVPVIELDSTGAPRKFKAHIIKYLSVPPTPEIAHVEIPKPTEAFNQVSVPDNAFHI